MYPENTITAFSKAQEIRGLSGIELDIQLTKDGEVVVIHDERVDRTTDGIGYVKDFTYLQLRKLAVKTGGSRAERIPTISEVLDVVQCKMEQGMLLNIELKNSEIRYDGMEERIFNLIVNRGLQDKIVYSSFYAKSLEKIRNLDSEAMVGVLDVKVSDCMYKKNGRAPSVLERNRPDKRAIERSDSAGLAYGTFIPGETYRDKAGSEKAGKSGHYGCVFE